MTHKIAVHYEDQFKETNYAWGLSLGYYYPRIGNNIYWPNSSNDIEYAIKLEFIGKHYWSSKKTQSGFYTYGKTGLSFMKYDKQYAYNPNTSVSYYGLNDSNTAVSTGVGLGIGYQNYIGKSKRLVYDLGIGVQYWLSGIQGNAFYTSADNEWINLESGGSVINANFRIGYVLKK